MIENLLKKKSIFIYMSKEKTGLKFESNSFEYAKRIVNGGDLASKPKDYRSAADRPAIGYKATVKQDGKDK